MSGSLDIEANQQNDTIIILVEEREYTVTKQWLKPCQLITTVLENDPTTTRIPLTFPHQVKHSDRTMISILKYLSYHHEHGPAPPIAKPLKGEHLKASGVGEWDITYIDQTDEELTELACAVNYMDIPDLLALTCAKIGSIMKSIINKYSTKEEQMAKVRERWYGNTTQVV